ncbi:hypothetical protein [Geodermatophilus amargosae]|uniref:hypothetical protein n=1 Tax=Geodermatophilus amargosae TaxID=1296565 RepID=UPI0034DF6A1F
MLAFVEAGLLLLLVLMVTIASVADDVPGDDVGIAVLVTLAACSLAGLDLLGGISLLRGTGRTVLVVTSCVEAGLLGLLFLVALVDVSTGVPVDPGGDAVGLVVVLLLLTVPVVRLVLVLQPAVAAWVAGRQRARTGPPVWAPHLGQWVAGPPPTSTAAAVATLVPVGVLAVVATVALAVGGSSTVVVDDFGTGHTGSGVPSDPPSPADADFDVRFDGDARDCHDGDMSACDDLYAETPVGDPYEEYGSTCGGRLDDETDGDCVRILGPTD